MVVTVNVAIGTLEIVGVYSTHWDMTWHQTVIWNMSTKWKQLYGHVSMVRGSFTTLGPVWSSVCNIFVVWTDYDKETTFHLVLDWKYRYSVLVSVDIPHFHPFIGIDKIYLECQYYYLTNSFLSSNSWYVTLFWCI